MFEKTGASLTDDIHVDDITSEQLQTVAYACGLDVAISLMRNLPGLELYIPAGAKRAFDLAYVRKHYNGGNAATIAGRLGLDRQDVIDLAKQKGELPPVMRNSHLRLIAGTCGDDVALALIKEFGGQKIYVPQNTFKNVAKHKILAEFNGMNTQELALKYGVSERFVRSIIADSHQEAIQESFLCDLW